MNLDTLTNANNIVSKIVEQEAILSIVSKLGSDGKYLLNVFLSTPSDSTLRYQIKKEYLQEIIPWLIAKHEVELINLKKELDKL